MRSHSERVYVAACACATKTKNTFVDKAANRCYKARALAFDPYYKLITRRYLIKEVMSGSVIMAGGQGAPRDLSIMKCCHEG